MRIEASCAHSLSLHFSLPSSPCLRGEPLEISVAESGFHFGRSSVLLVLISVDECSITLPVLPCVSGTRVVPRHFPRFSFLVNPLILRSSVSIEDEEKTRKVKRGNDTERPMSPKHETKKEELWNTHQR